MKKVLFATTALVATAGVAAADVTFGGYGRFGILHSSPDGGDSSTDITSRFRLQIDVTAESDAGVTVGARARIQQDNDGAATEAAVLGEDELVGTADDDMYRDDRTETGINGVRFFARSGGLEVGVGNIFGALEFMPGQYPIDLGLTGHKYDYTVFNSRGDQYDSDGNGGAGMNGVEVIYTMGDFSVHVSASDRNDRIAAVGAYTYNGWTFALGLQDSDDDYDTEVTASVGGTFGPADVTLAWARNGDDDVDLDPTSSSFGDVLGGDHWVLAARFDIGAATDVEAYIADADYFDDMGLGIDFNHDLGGGVSLRGGVSHNGSYDGTLVDAGVRFNF